MLVVYSYYVLDLVHRGHLLAMKNAKALAGEDGVSMIGILTDRAVEEKKQKPILSFDERVALAQVIKYNDIVVAQETYSPLANIRSIKPDVVIESTSHSEEDIEEVRRCVESIDSKMIVMPYFPSQSSSGIKKKINDRQK